MTDWLAINNLYISCLCFGRLARKPNHSWVSDDVQHATFGKELFNSPIWRQIVGPFSNVVLNMDRQMILCTLFNNTTCSTNIRPVFLHDTFVITEGWVIPVNFECTSLHATLRTCLLSIFFIQYMKIICPPFFLIPKSC